VALGDTVLSKDTQNLLGLYAARVGNYSLSLILVPYLSRTLGAEGLGLLAYAQGIGGYFTLLSDMGLGLFGERAIARERNLPSLPRLAWTLFLSRTGLAFSFLGLAMILLWIVEVPGENALLLAIGAAAVNQIFPGPILIGLEKQRYAALAGFFHHAVLLIFAVLFVRNPEDVERFLFGNLLFSSVNTFLGILWMKRKFGLPQWDKQLAWKLRAEAKPLFAFQAVVAVYTSLGSPLVFVLRGAEDAGIYAVAERVLRATLGLWGPYFALIPPKLAYTERFSPEDFPKLAKRYLKTALLFGLILFLILLSVAFLAPLIFGEGFVQATPLLLAFSPIPILVSLSNLLGLGVAFSKGLDYILLRASFLSALSFLVLGGPLIWGIGPLGAALGLLVAEAVALLSLRKVVNLCR